MWCGGHFSCHPLVRPDCGIRRAWPQARQVIAVQVSRLLAGFSHCTAVGNTLLLEDLGLTVSPRARHRRAQSAKVPATTAGGPMAVTLCSATLRTGMAPTPSGCKCFPRRARRRNGSHAINSVCGPRLGHLS